VTRGPAPWPEELLRRAAADRTQSWGRALFEARRDPVTWAGRVLEAAVGEPGGRPPEIAAALDLARDRDRWNRGREVFDLVRAARAADGEQAPEERRRLLRLAELVGKLAHNAAGPPPYFDHHAGWAVGPLAVRLAAVAPDPAARGRIAGALGDLPPDGPAAVLQAGGRTVRPETARPTGDRTARQEAGRSDRRPLGPAGDRQARREAGRSDRRPEYGN
jgi:hypothetical protein